MKDPQLWTPRQQATFENWLMFGIGAFLFCAGMGVAAI